MFKKIGTFNEYTVLKPKTGPTPDHDAAFPDYKMSRQRSS